MEISDIIVAVGANQAVSIAMTAMLDPGDEVLVPNPSWLHYFYCAELCGAKTVSYPLLEETSLMFRSRTLSISSRQRQR